MYLWSKASALFKNDILYCSKVFYLEPKRIWVYTVGLNLWKQGKNGEVITTIHRKFVGQSPRGWWVELTCGGHAYCAAHLHTHPLSLSLSSEHLPSCGVMSSCDALPVVKFFRDTDVLLWQTSPSVVQLPSCSKAFLQRYSSSLAVRLVLHCPSV